MSDKPSPILPPPDQRTSYLNDRVVVNDWDRAVDKYFRSFVKWLFDLMKNILVVVALGALAERSHSWLLGVLYQVCSILIGLYCASYAQGVYFYPLISPERSKIFNYAVILVVASIGLGVVIGINIGVSQLIAVISKAQAAK